MKEFARYLFEMHPEEAEGILNRIMDDASFWDDAIGRPDSIGNRQEAIARAKAFILEAAMRP